MKLNPMLVGFILLGLAMALPGPSPVVPVNEWGSVDMYTLPGCVQPEPSSAVTLNIQVGCLFAWINDVAGHPFLVMNALKLIMLVSAAVGILDELFPRLPDDDNDFDPEPESGSGSNDW